MTFSLGVAVGAVAHGPLPESVGFEVGAEGGRPRRPCRRRSGRSVDQFGRQAGAIRFGQPLTSFGLGQRVGEMTHHHCSTCADGISVGIRPTSSDSNDTAGPASVFEHAV